MTMVSPIVGCNSIIIPPPLAWFDNNNDDIGDDDGDESSSLLAPRLPEHKEDQKITAGLGGERDHQEEEANEKAISSSPLLHRPITSFIQNQDLDDDRQLLLKRNGTEVVPSRMRNHQQLITAAAAASSSSSIYYPDQTITITRKTTAATTTTTTTGTSDLFDPEALHSVGIPLPSPSLTEWAHQVLPLAARELVQNATLKLLHSARSTYDQCRPAPYYSELHSVAAVGYEPIHHWSHENNKNKNNNNNNSRKMRRSGPEGNDGSNDKNDDDTTPRFSSLPWVERQMVEEWRTVGSLLSKNDDPHHHYHHHNKNDDDADANDDATIINGQIDDEFAQARRIVPMPLPRPIWEKSEACYECLKPFGPVRLRHHCRRCGKSFCQVHSSQGHRLVQYGYGSLPERVCDACKYVLQQHDLSERLAWRSARWRDYQRATLTPYFEVGLDSLEDAMLRLTKAVIQCAKAIPLGAQATVAVETLDVLRKYGLNGIYTIMLRQEFLAAADLLLKALGINPTAFPLSVHELAAASFYALAQHRAMRGMSPEYEHDTHQSPSCEPLSNGDLQQIIVYAPIALNFVYMQRAVDMQLLAAQQGWRLLYSYLDQDDPRHDRPASALFVLEGEKIACLAIRGTATIQDVVTDIRQVPTPFPAEPPSNTTDESDWTTVSSGKGVAVSGMASAAYNLYREHHAILKQLAQDGYQIRLTGHSLGGSVATLLGLLVKMDLPETASLHVFAYGPPSCVDFCLADAMDSFVTTIVLHDDLVPRLTPTSCRSLLKHLLHIRETWVKTHLSSDIRAFKDRAKTAWAPKWRGGFTLSAASSSSRKLSRYCQKKLVSGKKRLVRIKAKVSDVMSVKVGSMRQRAMSIDHEDDYLGRDVTTATIDELSTLGGTTGEERSTCPVVDILGGMDLACNGIVVDGDEFFDAEDPVLDSSDNDSDGTESSAPGAEDSVAKSPLDPPAWLADHSSLDETDDISAFILDGQSPDQNKDAVVVEEIPLPNMNLAGRIVHIYSHRGVYKASYVPRDFRFLRKISVAGNMLSDHKTKHYYDALLEIGHVRNAVENAPKWTAFDEDDTWFTWASTSDNEAQEARDKHNCRSCGALVCDACSSNRVPVPTIGLVVPSRVCDRCYNDIGDWSETNHHNHNTSSSSSSSSGMTKKSTRRRNKRSAIVDELAAQVQASASNFGCKGK